MSAVDVTFRSLYEVLEKADSHVSDQQVKEALERNATRLLEGAASFKKPNKASETSVKSGKITTKGKSTDIDEKTRNFVLRISDGLDVDQVQAYELLESFIKGQRVRTEIQFNDSTVKQIADHYYDERYCLTCCAGALLRAAEDESHPYHKVCDEVAKKLLAGGFAEKVVAAYKELYERPLPKRWPETELVRLADSIVREQAALLEVLFLVYYTRMQCESDKIILLAEMFHKQNFAPNPELFALLTAPGRFTATRIGSLAVLILVEILDLESLLPSRDAMDDGIPPVHKLMKDPDRQRKLTAMFDKWGDLQQHAPVLLAWGAIVAMAAAQRRQDDASPALGSIIAPEYRYDLYCRRAVELQVFGYLRAVLQAEGQNAEESNLTGFKSVLKGLVSSLLISFDTTQFPYPLFEEVIMLSADIFRGQVSLCRQFIGQDIKVPALRTLLDGSRDRFPLLLRPLLVLLTALAADEVCARVVFVYVNSMMSFTTWTPSTQIIDTEIIGGGPGVKARDGFVALGVDVPRAAVGRRIAVDRFDRRVADEGRDADRRIVQWLSRETELYPNEVQRVRPLFERALQLSSKPESNEIDGIYIAEIARAMGVDGSSHDEVHYVASDDYDVAERYGWSRTLQYLRARRPFQYSGWRALHVVVQNFISQLNNREVSDLVTSEVACIFGLINELFTKEIDVVKRFDGSDPDGAPDFLPLVFPVVQRSAARGLADLNLMAGCVQTLRGYAQIAPERVWNLLKNTGLLPTSFANGLNRSALGYVLSTVETREGFYPVSIAALDLIILLQQHASRNVFQTKGKLPPSGIFSEGSTITMDSIFAMIMYARTEIFASYHGWRFAKIVERSELANRCLHLFNNVILDSTLATNELRRDMCGSFLEDPSMHGALLQILGTGSRSIERLYSDRRPLEAQSLETCVISAFKLNLSLSADRGSIAVSPLEHAILSRFVGKAPLVRVIAGYIHYPYGSILPTVALHTLSALCAPASRMSSLSSASLVGFWGAEAYSLRDAIINRLHNSHEQNELRIAILGLISAGLGTQAGLAELLLNAPPPPEKQKAKVTPAAAAPSAAAAAPAATGAPAATATAAAPGGFSFGGATKTAPAAAPTATAAAAAPAAPAPSATAAPAAGEAGAPAAEGEAPKEGEGAPPAEAPPAGPVTPAATVAPVAAAPATTATAATAAPAAGATPVKGGFGGLSSLKAPAKAAATAAAATGDGKSGVSFLAKVVKKADEMLKKQPRLLAACLSLLHGIWELRSDHRRVVGLLRGQPDFWNNLGSVLMVDVTADAASKPTPTECYQLAGRAWVLRIFALELYTTVGALDRDMNGILSMFANSGRYVKWAVQYSKCSYEASLHEATSNQAVEMGLDMALFCTPHTFDHAYGDQYVFDVENIKSKVMANNRMFLVFVDRLVKVNHMFSLYDAQINLLRAFRAFVEVASQSKHTQSTKILESVPATAAGGQKTAIPSAILTELATQLAKDEAEERGGPVVPIFQFELSALLLSVCHHRANSKHASDANIETIMFIHKNIHQAISRLTVAVAPDPAPIQGAVGSLLACSLLVLAEAERCKLKEVPTAAVKNSKDKSLVEAEALATLRLGCGLIDHVSVSRPDALITLLCRCVNFTQSAESWLIILQEYNVLPRLVERISVSMRELRDLDIVSATLSFLLSIASGPLGAEAVAVAGFMPLVISASPALLESGGAYNADGELNPWRRVWVTILHMVAVLLRHLPTSEEFFETCLEFVSMHATTFHTAITIELHSGREYGMLSGGFGALTLQSNILSGASSTPSSKFAVKNAPASRLDMMVVDDRRPRKYGLSLLEDFRENEAAKQQAAVQLATETNRITMGKIYEAEGVTAILNAMSRYSQRWKLLTPKLVHTLSNHSAVLVQRILSAMQKQGVGYEEERLAQSLHAVSRGEKKHQSMPPLEVAAVPPSPGSTPVGSPRKENLIPSPGKHDILPGPPSSPPGHFDKPSAPRSNLFVQNAELALYPVLRNALSFLSALLPVGGAFDPYAFDACVPLFALSPTGGAAQGYLKILINLDETLVVYRLKMLRRGHNETFGPILPTLQAILEMSTYIALVHAGHYVGNGSLSYAEQEELSMKIIPMLRENLDPDGKLVKSVLFDTAVFRDILVAVESRMPRTEGAVRAAPQAGVRPGVGDGLAATMGTPMQRAKTIVYSPQALTRSNSSTVSRVWRG